MKNTQEKLPAPIIAPYIRGLAMTFIDASRGQVCFTIAEAANLVGCSPKRLRKEVQVGRLSVHHPTNESGRGALKQFVSALELARWFSAGEAHCPAGRARLAG